MFSIKRILSDSLIPSEDTPESKLMKFDSESESESNKKSRKKPSLNYEILEEIFVKLINEEKRYSKKRNENFVKFMLSGVQQFEVALNYFKRIHQVDFKIISELMFIYPPETVPPPPITNCYQNSQTCHFISLNCVLLKPILKALGNSIKTLHVYCHLNKRIIEDSLDYLIKEGLENVCFNTYTSDKNFELLCNVTTIKYLDCPIKIAQLPMIRLKSPIFKLKTEFADILCERPQKIVLPWVEELTIQGDFEIFDITRKSINRFINSIFEIFPNTKILNAYFNCSNSFWKPVYTKMKEIQPLWFTPLFQRYIEGEIQFYANITQLEYEEFAKYRDEDNEYIVDIGIAVKEFNIHDEFYFEFQLRD